MDNLDLVSALLGAGVTLVSLAAVKYLPKLAAKTDNKIDDAAALYVAAWLADPKNQEKVVEYLKGIVTSPKK